MQATTDSIDDFVTATIAELSNSPPGDVRPETLLIDLGVDSLQVSTLATFIEAQYDCAFTPGQLLSLYSAVRVDDVVLAVRQTISEPGSLEPAT